MVLYKNRPGESKVPIGFRFLSMHKSMRVIEEKRANWRKYHPNQPFIISYNTIDKYYSLWTKTTKGGRSGLGETVIKLR